MRYVPQVLVYRASIDESRFCGGNLKDPLISDSVAHVFMFLIIFVRRSDGMVGDNCSSRKDN